MKDLRIVFMGTPDFAVESLKQLIEADFNIVGVITAPDKPAGRGHKLKQSPVKKFAVKKNIPVLQPQKLKNKEFISELTQLKADLQVVVAFRMLPEVVWAMPPRGTINLHASLLPQYRGAAPINWAIINGEKETGATTFFIRHQIDTGNIIFQEKIPIAQDENAQVVHDKLMVMGADLLVKTVKAIAENNFPEKKQQDILSKKVKLKHAPKIFKQDCKINWQQDCHTIYNFIRGLSPYPVAWFELENIKTGKKTTMRIFEATYRTEQTDKPAGTIISDNKNFIGITTNNGIILLKDLQLQDKKRMQVEDFLRGFDIETVIINLY